MPTNSDGNGAFVIESIRSLTWVYYKDKPTQMLRSLNHFLRPAFPPSVFPVLDFFNRCASFLVTTVSNAAAFFFFGTSIPAFLSRRPSFAPTRALLSFFIAIRGFSPPAISSLPAGLLGNSTNHSFSSFLLAPLYPHLGTHSPVSSSKTVFGVFCFLIPFFLAKSSHFVGGLDFGT